MPLGLDVLRTLEHHVFEQVRKSRAPGLLVLGPDVIPDLHVNDRRGMILEKHHVEAVRQRGCRVIELRRTNRGMDEWHNPERDRDDGGGAEAPQTNLGGHG
jgi:hypothetical protein